MSALWVPSSQTFCIFFAFHRLCLVHPDVLIVARLRRAAATPDVRWLTTRALLLSA